MHSRVATGFLSLVILCIGVGCGGKHNSTPAATTVNPTVRLANATRASTLMMNGVGASDATATFASSAVAAGGVTDYSSESAQTYTVGIGAANGSLTASTQSLGLSASTNYTLLAFERGGAINTYTLIDNQSTPAAGFATVLVANAAGDAGALDVYLVSSSTALNGVAPVFSNVATKSTAPSRAITAGTYDIVVTANGKANDVRLSIPGVVFASTDIVTVALTSTPGGSLVDGELIKQGGAMQLAPSTVARVRVAGAFPANTANNTNSVVTVSVGTTSLGTLTAPSVGTYKLVAGGTSVYTVNVDGTPVAALPATTFVTGGDYTILVAGVPGTPSVNVLADNNQPSNSGNANIRLVNGSVVGSITLSDNFVPVDVDVPYGQASDYGPATPLSTSLLQITSPVANFPSYSATNVNIVSGGVYTIFVLGRVDLPVVSLSKDR